MPEQLDICPSCGAPMRPVKAFLGNGKFVVALVCLGCNRLRELQVEVLRA